MVRRGAAHGARGAAHGVRLSSARGAGVHWCDAWGHGSANGRSA
jgi:hypothetical protein